MARVEAKLSTFFLVAYLGFPGISHPGNRLMGSTSLGISASANGVTLTASATSVGVNSSVTITANKPVDWSLAPGSLGSLRVDSPTQAAFLAPASIPARHAQKGCQLSPNNSVFNTRIDTLPVDSQSEVWTSTRGTSGRFSINRTWGMALADGNTPTYPMRFAYTPKNNTPSWPIPDQPNFRQGGSNDGNGAHDHHTVTIRPSDCQIFETYNYQPNFVPYSCGYEKTCTGQSGVSYAANSNQATPIMNGSSDAARMPLAPLTLNAEDVRHGLNHALRFTVNGAIIGKVNPVWPSFSRNAYGEGAPYGTRYRLKASYDISTASPFAQNILRGLQQYGMFLADATCCGIFSAAANQDIFADLAVKTAMNEVNALKLPISVFEVVDESSLLVASDSYQVNPLSPYVSPDGAAYVIAVDQANSQARVMLDIPLQPVIVAFPAEQIDIQAGDYSWTVPYWVTGTNDQSVTWSLSGPGSLVNGVYTPPATIPKTQSAAITATSTVDPSQSRTLQVTLLKEGTLRMDLGSPDDSVDGSGRYWTRDVGGQMGSGVLKPHDSPTWPALKAPPLSSVRHQWQSWIQNYGDDLNYTFVMPNGNYRLHAMFAEPHNGNKGTTANPGWHRNYTLLATGVDGQLQRAIHSWTFGISTNYTYGVPVDTYLPLTVTNNLARFALVIDNHRHDSRASYGVVMSGLEFLPDNSAPHLQIDAYQQQTTIAAGATLQLFAVGWYMSNNVIWSLTEPAGADASVTPRGLFKGFRPGDYVITATSVVDPAMTATKQITVE